MSDAISREEAIKAVHSVLTGIVAQEIEIKIRALIPVSTQRLHCSCGAAVVATPFPASPVDDELIEMLRLRKELDPDAPDMIVLGSAGDELRQAQGDTELDAETDAAFDDFLRTDPEVQAALREKAQQLSDDEKFGKKLEAIHKEFGTFEAFFEHVKATRHKGEVMP